MKLHRIIYVFIVLSTFQYARVWNGDLASYVRLHTNNHGYAALSALLAYLTELALASWVMVTITARERQDQAREKVSNAGPRAPGPNDVAPL